MAAGGSGKSYWQSVELTYTDGFVLNATLDQSVVNQLENPATREQLMTTIRQNATNVTGLNTQASNIFLAAEESQTTSIQAEDYVSDPSDVEANSGDVEVNSAVTGYTSWPREAILYLIELFKEFEPQLEDPLVKKKRCVEENNQKNGRAGL